MQLIRLGLNYSPTIFAFALRNASKLSATLLGFYTCWKNTQ